MVRRVEGALKCQPVLLCASLPAPPCHVTTSPQSPYLNQKGGGSAGWGPEGQGHGQAGLGCGELELDGQGTGSRGHGQ